MIDILSDLKERLVTLLTDWDAGRLNERDIHEAAEELLETIGWQEFNRSDPRSVVMEVLSQLEMLHIQWITAHDAPIMIEFIQSGITDPYKAWQDWESYWDSVDFEKRKEALKYNEYYAV